jgi:hypothetical protein
MTKIFLIIIVLLLPQDKPAYPLKNGRPTSKGIEKYVEEHGDRLIGVYQDFIGDSLFDIYLYTADLTENGYYNPLELGRYFPNEIFITTTEVFVAYDLESFSRKGRDNINYSNLFVKTAVFHELSHHYINQVGMEMSRLDSLEVDRAYQAFFRIYSAADNPGFRFIEEGICEYVCLMMGEILAPRKPWIPRNASALNKKENTQKIYYQYASHYLSTFLDTTGLREGIKILLHNPPPSQEEILDPDLFFSRLEIIH